MLRICLGIPIVGDPCGEAYHHHLRLAVTLSRFGVVNVPEVREVLPHDVARSRVVELARKSESDLLFFVDDDTVVPYKNPNAFELLYQAMQERGAKVVSGHYYRRGNPYTCVWSKIVQGEFHSVDAALSDQVHEIDFSGLGCALIDFKWMMKNLEPPYFTMGKDDEGTVVLDDTSFYQKVRNAGGLILGHAGVRCIHIGGRTPVCDETVDYLRREYNRVEELMKGISNGSRNNRSQSLSGNTGEGTSEAVRSSGG